MRSAITRPVITRPVIALGAAGIAATAFAAPHPARKPLVRLEEQASVALPYGRPSDLQAVEERVYLANGAGGVLAFDTTDPLHVVELGRFQPAVAPAPASNPGTPATPRQAEAVIAVAARNRWIYLLTEDVRGLERTSRVLRVDASDPAHMRANGEADLPASAVHLAAVSDTQVAVSLHAAGGDPKARPSILLIDFATPATPRIISKWILPPGEGALLGRLAYASETICACGLEEERGSSNGSVQILSTAEPERPELLAALRTRGPARDIAINPAATVAYLACGPGGVNVVDITDRAAPRLLGALDLGGVSAERVSLSGDRLYVGTPGELVRFDVAIPLRPRRLPSLPTLYPTNALTAGPGFVALSVPERGVDFLQPRPDGALRDGSSVATVGDAPRLRRVGETLLAALGPGGLAAFDVSRPDRIRATADIRLLPANRVAAPVSDAVPAGTKNVWLAAGAGGILVTPSHGSFISRVKVPVTGGGETRLARSGTSVYAVGNGFLLRAYDAADPHRPTRLGELNAREPGTAGFGIAIRDKTAVVAAGSAGAVIVDVSQPASPRVSGHWGPPGSPDCRDVEIAGSRALLVDRHSGLFALDISDPAAPRLVAGDTTVGHTCVAAQGEIVFLTGGTAESLFLRMSRGEIQECEARPQIPLLASSAAWLGGDRPAWLAIGSPGRVAVYRVRADR